MSADTRDVVRELFDRELFPYIETGRSPDGRFFLRAEISEKALMLYTRYGDYRSQLVDKMRPKSPREVRDALEVRRPTPIKLRSSKLQPGKWKR